MPYPEYLLMFYYNRELNNEDFKLVFMYWIESLLTPAELERMRIEYQEIGGKWKRKSIQYKEKNKAKIIEQLFSVKLNYIAIEKAELHDGSRRNHDFHYYFNMSQPITVSMQIEMHKRTYGSIKMMMNHRMTHIENRFQQYVLNSHLLHLNPNTTHSNLVYGYLLVMDKSKDIIFYSESIGTPNLTQEEITEKDLLNDNLQFLPIKIWKTTYLNILNQNQLNSNKLLNEIKKQRL